MGRKRVDMTGRRIGRLVVLRDDPNNKNNVICKCDCGNIKSIPRSQMYGQIKSCGCLLRESSRNTGNKVCKQNFSQTYEIMRKYHTHKKALKPKGLPKNNSSGAIGVCINKNTGKYHAYITLNYRQKNLGTYSTFSEALDARKEAEEKYYKPLLESIRNDMGGVA